MFRPSAGIGIKKFKDEGYSSGALNKRLQYHLKARGWWVGETTHGVRRGRVQDDRRVRGKTLAAIAEEGHWSQVETVALYAHPTRHVQRLVESQSSRPSDEVGSNAPSGVVAAGLAADARAGDDSGLAVGPFCREPEASEDRETGHECR